MNRPNGPRPRGVEPVDKLPGVNLHRPVVATGRASSSPRSVPTVSPRRLRAQEAVAVTDTTFRDAHQSAAGHPGAHPRPGRRRAARRPAGPRAAQPGVLGRRHLRRRAAVPRRGPVGAARGAAGRRAEHLHCRCCCAAATPSATRRTRRRSPTPSSPRPRATGMDIFRIFDALNDVGQMRPAIDAVRATGTAVAEVALCYTGDLSDPAETALHARLLPAPGRADRRGGRARAGDQGHGRAAAPARRPDAGQGAARAVRPARAPAHPRHGGRPARHADHGDRRGGGRRGRGASRRWQAPPASRRCPRSSRPPTTPSGPPACDRQAVADLEPYWEAVRKVYAPFESGLRVADRPRLHPRDPRRAAVQPAAAGRSRSGSATGSS